MRTHILPCLLALALACALALGAAPTSINGIVHDPQHRPIPGAQVTLRAAGGHTWKTNSNQNGEFEFQLVPPGGPYVLEAQAPGFELAAETIQIREEHNPVFHIWMKVAAVRQQVKVSGAPALLNTETSTVQTLVTHAQIAQTPGADLAGSFAMITDFVPGAYVVHDTLHVRGGHQENWFVDGIPIVNTSIASNLGPAIAPKDVQSLQVQTGGYSSEYGDRSFGFFNVVTPSGFDRNSQAELVTSYGSFNRTDDLLSFGSHTDRFAYYASVNGNRSGLGLSTPTPQVIHAQEAGLGTFASVLYNASPQNQLRFITSIRGQHYQIPNTPEQQSAGIRDLEIDRDAMTGVTWAHSSPGGAVLTVSPFFHFNRANYVGGPADTPFILNDNRRSSYEGALASFAVPAGKNKFRTALEVWGQHDNTIFGLSENPGDRTLRQSFQPWANSEAVSFEDAYQSSSWLNLNAGVRLSHYGGLISENAAEPRVGASIQIPKVHWLVHGYFARLYQPPPLDTISGPLLAFASEQGVGFIPLHGERDRQWDAGISIPVRGWFLNFDRFRTSASNFLDHDELGNSDIFLPLTDRAALVRGNEVTLRSPEMLGRVRLNVVYSNQIVQGLGPVTGGLLEFAPSEYFFLDHDQRNTASAVVHVRLPRRSWASSSYEYGSGFLEEDGPAHLPPHSSWNLALGHSIGEKFSISFNALNVSNTRYMLDDSNTFGGTHFINPRELYVEVRWRFHY